MDHFWYAYVDSDGKGNIIDGIVGLNVMPTKQYDHFFLLDGNIELMNHKVELEDGKAKLVEK